jgi:hypothetical protein
MISGSIPGSGQTKEDQISNTIQYNITKHIYMNNIKKCHIFTVKVIH